MVYDRTHTRDFNDLETMGLNKLLPFAAGTFVVAGIASMGLPGFSGFVAELQVLWGAWQAFPTAAIVAGVGIIVGVAYTLRAIQKAFYADAPAPEPDDEVEAHHPLPPVSVPERLGAALLIATSLAIGLFPNLLLHWIQPCLNSPLFQHLVKGGAL
jgi:NADH-quinone oxidoreductase subunit M